MLLYVPVVDSRLYSSTLDSFHLQQLSLVCIPFGFHQDKVPPYVYHENTTDADMLDIHRYKVVKQ